MGAFESRLERAYRERAATPAPDASFDPPTGEDVQPCRGDVACLPDKVNAYGYCQRHWHEHTGDMDAHAAEHYRDPHCPCTDDLETTDDA